MSDGNRLLGHQDAAFGDRLEPGALLSAEPANDVAAQVEHVIGTLSKGRILDGLNLPVPPLQHPPHDRLGRQKAFAQLALEFPRGKQRAQHLTVRPKDARECGVEFPFDALGIVIQLSQRLLERVPQAEQLFFDVVLADGRGRPIPVEWIADKPGRPQGQARRNAASG